MKTTITLFLALLLTSCGTISPETFTGAVRSHAAFPSLSQSVSDCLVERPEVRDQVRPDFNYLVSLWQEAGDLDMDESLLTALVDARSKLAKAEQSWMSIKTSIVASGVDCGPYVKGEVANLERTFSEIKTAIQANERIILAGQYVELIARIALGSRAEVVRM